MACARYSPPVDASGRIAAHLRTAVGELVVPPPGEGEGNWAGASSAVFHDGVWWLCYRLRQPLGQGRGRVNVIARSADGVSYEPVAMVDRERFGAASLERPALVALPGGGWRLYVSCSTPSSKHWWVEALDAPTPEALPGGVRTVVLAGDEVSAWKDVVVRRAEDHWQMWACRHLLDEGDDQADRMESWYATSTDGLAWTLRGPALLPSPAGWDRRGARITSVLPGQGRWAAFYDGRATAAQNWHERTGLALGATPTAFTPGPEVRDDAHVMRYLDVVTTASGHRLFWESARPDGAHDLRTDFLPRQP